MLRELFSKNKKDVKISFPIEDLERLTEDSFVDISYKLVLRRQADAGGKKHYSQNLKNKRISRDHFLDSLIDSDEFSKNLRFSNLGTSLHESRLRFIRGLPKAAHIVDLGGSSQDSDNGALVDMGYPYSFSKLTIIDLPIDARHELYQNNREIKQVQTLLGPVEYFYQSMADLQPIPDHSIDMVYSGQSIEHVTTDDAKRVFAEVKRVLKPGGFFCLDTPNGRITRLQQDEFVDPDHKIEYTHEQLSSALMEAGFHIREAKGLNYAGDISTRSEFSPSELAKNCGVFSDIRNCYLLAYICQT